MFSAEYKVRIRYGETDQMGIVYHGNYPQYLEIGRIEWLRKLGISYKEMEKNGILLPVYNLNINYLKSSYYDDELTIITELLEKPGVKISFFYKIINEENEIISTAQTTLVFVNAKTGKPMRCPEFILKKLY